MRPSSILFALFPLLAACGAPTPAWPQFRGLGGLALAADTPIPLDFGPDSRVLWKTAVPAGHSSPCVHGQRIFLTGADADGLHVLALDRATGDVLWSRMFAGEPDQEYGHVAAADAVSTPCTDGERVFAYFGPYGLVALDIDGALLWEQRMPVANSDFGAGSSPILAGGRVILMRDGTPEAAVLAFDVEHGEEVWSIPRLGFMQSHSTPFLWHTAEREELVLAGTKQLRAHDPRTGAFLWNVDNVTLFACTTPTADADTLYFAGWSSPNSGGRPLLEESFGAGFEISDAEADDYGVFFDRLDADDDARVVIEELPPSRARDAFTALDLDGSGAWERVEFLRAVDTTGAPGKNIAVAIAAGGEGDITDSHVRWTWTRSLPYVASPLLYRGRLWLFKAGGIATCLDARTGEPLIARERMPAGGEYYMSPVGAADHVLVGSVDGTLLVLDATADALRIVHTAEFDEGLYATPAVLDGKVYLRTPTTMWAFGD